MNKQRASWLIGFMSGSALTLSIVTLIFITTTVSYHSSIFPQKRIILTHFRK